MTTLNRTKRLLNDLVPETGGLPSLEDVRKSINDATLKRQSESKKAESKSQSRVPHLELGSVRSLPFLPLLICLSRTPPDRPTLSITCSKIFHLLIQQYSTAAPRLSLRPSTHIYKSLRSLLSLLSIDSLSLPLSSFSPGFSHFFVSPSERNRIGLQFRTVPL
jgi:hypothetical protein